MVNLYAVCIYKWDAQKPITVASSFELSSFSYFTKGTAKEVLQFVCNKVVASSKPGDKHSILHQQHLCHVMIKQDGLAIAAATDEDYPQRVVFSFMLKCIDGFSAIHGDRWKNITTNTELPTPQLGILLKKYQVPEEAGIHFCRFILFFF